MSGLGTVPTPSVPNVTVVVVAARIVQNASHPQVHALGSFPAAKKPYTYFDSLQYRRFGAGLKETQKVGEEAPDISLSLSLSHSKLTSLLPRHLTQPAQDSASFEEHLFIGLQHQPEQHFTTTPEEAGLTGWVPLEEQGGFQHQPTSVTLIVGNEALIGHSNLDQFQYPSQTVTTAATSTATASTTSFHPQPVKETTFSNSVASWNVIPEQQQQPSSQPQIYETAGEAVAGHQHQNLQPLVPSPIDLVSGSESQLSTGAAGFVGTSISPQVYKPSANDNAFLESRVAYHQDQQNVLAQAICKATMTSSFNRTSTRTHPAQAP
ncbi:hypothetical protein FRB90_005057 [Tulasnella sp. 427]|nr:hypothetical protein FRB90_005057 [Tulasnella sp. 427]